MQSLQRLLTHPYFVWVVLTLPAVPMLYAVVQGTANYHRLLHPTGEWSARFMILAMMVTPLVMLIGANGFTRWLLRQRRYLGVAAFGFAVLHTVFYLVAEGTLEKVLGEALEPGILTGWLAFLIFVPLAVTSNDASVRALRQWWKPLQRWVYPAAVLTLAHWLLVSHGIGGALVHFAPLAFLEAYRVWRNVSRAGLGRVGAAA